jgi:proteasome lid subunit RPN8/RPN11
MIREHAERDYPGECCGALIGGFVGDANYISLAVPLTNKHEEGVGRRFRITSDDLMNVEKIARRLRKSVTGFYHSHPDCPPVPSAYDTDHAWEVYSYLIIQVNVGVGIEHRSWKLDGKSGRFNEEPVQVNRCILEATAESAKQQTELE